MTDTAAMSNPADAGAAASPADAGVQGAGDSEAGSPGAVRHDGPRLDDRYTQTSGRVFLSGNQALVRLPIQQRLKDQAAGLNTGAYISGYRGSPLGRYDMELWGASRHLEKLNIRFQSGVNEDMAATAIWGTQNVGLVPGAQVDGVFGLWYGKGPGVDRCGDVFKHANFAGTSPNGGVLALAGDDHGAKSSTNAHQSEPGFMAAGMPVLAPANVQDILDLGLHGIAMSRYSGCWVGLKLVTDVVESAATVDVDLDRVRPVLPPKPPIPGGVSIRLHDPAQLQEARLFAAKLPLAVAYARANRLDRVTHDAPDARIGIVAAGKAYADTLQALAELGLSRARCEQLGIRVLKLGMVFPLDPEVALNFAKGLKAILVVEEKRPLIEQQLKNAIYDAGLPEWPKVIGKPALPNFGELNPNIVAHALAKVLGQPELAAAIALPTPPKLDAEGRVVLDSPMRLPSFCSGCPHNTSTRLPDGSRALAGIGCHTIAMLNNPHNTMSVSHMGGEGMMWAGQAPFTAEKHVFANMGDGTYFHSGLLAIRSAIASKVNITYKLLFNGFVSMTGGQPVDGELTVSALIQQVKAEGVRHVVVTTEDPERVKRQGLPADVPVHHRRELDRLQRELREMPGVTVLIHDQPCATERRRLRKRGKWEDPPVRTFIHPEICEGCGDCGAQSGCLSIEPLETPLGRKRRINQSTCNKDFSCVNGFCPSFVTVHGAQLRKPAPRARPVLDETALPTPAHALEQDAVGVLINGIGGTGVVTVGAIVSMAAHLDGLCCSTLDVTGLAQKYGAVMTHMRLSRQPDALTSARLALGEADVIVGCDLLVTAGDECLSRMRPGVVRAVVNTEEVPTSGFSRDPDWRFDAPALRRRIEAVAGTQVQWLDAAALAREVLGDSVFANMIMLGWAWQLGMIPVTLGSMRQAIELNGVQPKANLEAFTLGRMVAARPEEVARLREAARPAHVIALPVSESLDVIVRDRVARLTDYQNAALARRYGERVTRIQSAAHQAGAGEAIARTVARQYYRLLAHKDEFEVARLYSEPSFREMLAAEFDGELTVHYHLGGGPFTKRDAGTGKPIKSEKVFMMPRLLGWLASLRGLRGGWLDPFRHNEERQLARRLLAQYEADLDRIERDLTPSSAEALARLAGWPAQVRGYGHVRAASAVQALAARESATTPVAAGAPAAVAVSRAA